MPLQLVQRPDHFLRLQRQRAFQQGWGHQIAQYGGGGEHPLGRRAQPPNPDADGGDHRVRKVAGQALIEGPKRLRPCSRNGAEIEAERDCPQELNREQRQSGRIGRNPAHHAVDGNRVVTRQHSLRQVAEPRSVQHPEPQRLAAELAADLDAELVELGPRRVGRDREDQRQRRGGEVAKHGAEREGRVLVEPLCVVHRDHDGLFLHRRPKHLCQCPAQRMRRRQRRRSAESLRPFRQHLGKGGECGRRCRADAGSLEQTAARERKHAAPRLGPVGLDRPGRGHRDSVESQPGSATRPSRPGLSHPRVPLEHEQRRAARAG